MKEARSTTFNDTKKARRPRNLKGIEIGCLRALAAVSRMQLSSIVLIAFISVLLLYCEIEVDRNISEHEENNLICSFLLLVNVNSAFFAILSSQKCQIRQKFWFWCTGTPSSHGRRCRRVQPVQRELVNGQRITRRNSRRKVRSFTRRSRQTAKHSYLFSFFTFIVTCPTAVMVVTILIVYRRQESILHLPRAACQAVLSRLSRWLSRWRGWRWRGWGVVKMNCGLKFKSHTLLVAITLVAWRWALWLLRWKFKLHALLALLHTITLAARHAIRLSRWKGWGVVKINMNYLLKFNFKLHALIALLNAIALGARRWALAES